MQVLHLLQSIIGQDGDFSHFSILSGLLYPPSINIDENSVPLYQISSLTLHRVLD